jgi:hypothetical protein
MMTKRAFLGLPLNLNIRLCFCQIRSLMHKNLVVAFCFFLAGCVSHGNSIEMVQKNPEEANIQIEKRNQRIELLKERMAAYGYKPELLVEVKSMFNLMSAFQDGRVTGESVKGFSFFLQDSLGIDNGNPNLSTYLQCVQVIPVDGVKDNEGKEIKVYKALYSNPFITLTASVYWYNTQPLVGQKLNTDFLLYLSVGEYKTKGGDSRGEVQFIRPQWAN